MGFQPTAGTEIAGYVVVAPVGRGGMASVYLAEDRALGRKVALKLLDPTIADDDSFPARFAREAKIAAGLEHPNVVPIYGAGEWEGLLFIAMRYVDGTDLRRLLEREGSVPVERALGILTQVASALDAAHAQGLVHRDVKPANVLLAGAQGPRGEELAYLADFGLARPIIADSSLTAAGAIYGTLDYMAPEQIEGRVVDARTDVYSLGCVLYECLMGEPPFRRETAVATLAAHLRDEPPSMGGRGVPGAFDHVIAVALAKEKGERFSSGRALMEASRTALSDGRAASATRPPEPEEQPAPRETRKTVTVLFAGLTESTALGERLDPEVLSRVMSRFFEEMSGVVVRHGGTVEKLIGDAITAVFGIPRVHEDDALRAVRAAHEMHAAMDGVNEWLHTQWGIVLRARIGVSTGEVVAGNRGEGQLSVTGDAVNAAARLEEAAPPGEVLLSDPTYQLVRGAVQAVAREPVEVKGKEHGVRAWRLVSLGGLVSTERRLSSSMVGRQEEFRLLVQALERAEREQTCHLFTVIGGAGVGKSRLIAEFLGSLQGRATVLRGRCLSYGEGITYWPISEIVKEAARITEADSAQVARGRLSELVHEMADADLIESRLAQVLGLEEFSSAPEETFWALRHLIEHLARDRPLVMVVEDMHWAEATLLDLIEYVADWSRGAPVLLLSEARYELFDRRPEWAGGKLNATTVALESLSEGDSRELIENLLGSGELPLEVRSRVETAAEGNPLFLEETLGMLIDDGILVRHDGTWVSAAGVSQVVVPPTISALLSARIDQLEDEERDVIQRAAVVGREFYRGAVTDLCPPAVRPQVPARLMTLVRRELVRPLPTSPFPGEDGFRFRHILIRDAAYQALPKNLRAELHERFGDWVERAAGDRVAEYEEVVGYHFEHAYRYREELGPPDEASRSIARRAGIRLASAAHRAFGRGDMRAAANLLTRATSMPPWDERTRIGLLVELGEALYETAELVRADGVLQEAYDAAGAAGDERLQARATVVRLLLRALTEPQGWTDQAAREAERLIPVFERLGDESSLVRAWNVLHMVNLMRARYDDAAEASRLAAEHAALSGEERKEVEGLAVWASTAVFGSTPVAEGLRRCKEVRDRARTYPVVEAQVQLGLAGLKAMNGEFDDARQLVARCRALWEGMGMKLAVASSTVLFSAFVETLAGDLPAAEAELRWGYKALLEIGEQAVRATLAANLASVLFDMGRSEEAEMFAAACEGMAAPEDLDAQVLWRRVRARLLSKRADHLEAESMAREALLLADRTDDLDLIAGATADLAEVIRAGGNREESEALLTTAMEAYERKGNRIAAARIRSRLKGTEGRHEGDPGG